MSRSVEAAAPPDFPPTLEAAFARLKAVRPGDYARTRNHLEGAVTWLSPYITHGLLTVPQVVQALQERHALPRDHKLLQELAWREFFHHAWGHDGDGIFQSLRPGPRPEGDYARQVPGDLREACTGVPVVDEAVRTLYATGTLHNHARLWLASYTVHLRKVHWRPAADWLYAHLLDGDLGSNHLSWQWVSGTGSHKPYLFDNGNVERWAPVPWHSPGTVVDHPFEKLEALAHTARRAGPEPGAWPATPEPALHRSPPADLTAAHAFTAPDAAVVAGRDVWLLHPWALGELPLAVREAQQRGDTVVVAVVDAAFFTRWAWSGRRWHWVAARLAALTPHRWWGPGDAWRAALGRARTVQGVHNLHLGPAFGPLALSPRPRQWADPPRRCRSFSAFWSAVSGG